MAVALVPMTRDSMRLLKSKKDEEIRLLKAKKAEEERLKIVHITVENIYNSAITVAEYTTKSSFRLAIGTVTHGALYDDNFPMYNGHQPTIYDYTFIRENMKDILDGLRKLFVDCLVQHKTIAVLYGGESCDITNMDIRAIPLLEPNLVQNYIVIEWGA